MISRLVKITLFLFASGVFFFASDQVVSGQSAQCCQKITKVILNYQSSNTVTEDYDIYDSTDQTFINTRVETVINESVVNSQVCEIKINCTARQQSVLDRASASSACADSETKGPEPFLDASEDFLVRYQGSSLYARFLNTPENERTRILNVFFQEEADWLDLKNPEVTNCIANIDRDILQKRAVNNTSPIIEISFSFVTEENKVSCTSESACMESLKSFTGQCASFSGLQQECNSIPSCKFYRNNCLSIYDHNSCHIINEPSVCNSFPACSFNPQVSLCISRTEDALVGNVEGQSNILPNCAIAGSCRSVEDLIFTAIKLAREIFGVIGAAAFAMFIYGGGLMVASFGNEERFTKGKQAITAAVIGLIIAFSAYILVGYILSLFGVSQSFNIYEIRSEI